MFLFLAVGTGTEGDAQFQNILCKEKRPGEPLIVKVSDFGLSSISFESSPVAETPCGTRGYTAPEITSGRYHSEAVDLYSLGVMLYVMYDSHAPCVDTIV